MKKLILSTVLFSLLFISCKEEKSKEKETIKEKKEEVKPVPEKAKDVITWKGYKPTGSHTGTISVQSTDFKFVEDSLSGGTIVLDMNTIQNKDITDAKDKSNLEAHLKSADFFDVVKHPTSTFEISGVESDKEGKIHITGKLTMNGVSKEITFSASIEGNLLTSDLIKIDRTDFGIKYKSKKFFENLKDKFINDEFEISFVNISIR